MRRELWDAAKRRHALPLSAALQPASLSAVRRVPLALAAERRYLGRTVEMDAFAAMSQRVIADEGFDEHVPTACYPQRRVVRVLEDAPDAVDFESVALDWALAAAEGDEEVLVVFKINPTHFKVIRRAGGRSEHCVYPATSMMNDRGHS